jgi:AraC-binding-like domain
VVTAWVSATRWKSQGGFYVGQRWRSSFSVGIGMTIKPLDRFPFIRTTDVDAMREAIAKAHGENKLQPQRGGEGFHASGNRRVLRNIVLSYATFGAAVDQEFSAFTGFAQQFRIRGSTEIIVDRAPVQLAPYQSFILSPGRQ